MTNDELKQEIIELKKIMKEILTELKSINGDNTFSAQQELIDQLKRQKQIPNEYGGIECLECHGSGHARGTIIPCYNCKGAGRV